MRHGFWAYRKYFKGAIMNSMRQLFLSILCCLCFLQSFSLPAYSATEEKDQWIFHLTPYSWLAGQRGTVATLPELPPADIDIDFYDDVLDNLNGALMLVGEVRQGRVGVVLDISYIDIESEEPLSSSYFSQVSSTTKTWMVSTAAFYRLFEADKEFLDLLAGIRYWSVESGLTLTGGTHGPKCFSNREEWVDPILGLKGLTVLGDSNFFLIGNFLIGGFGVESDFMWDATLNLGYAWTETFSTTIGYRYLDVDYQKDDFLYDVSQSGPIIGFSWRF
ncbi:conserved hypothetical protein [Desulfotalea psychrophila LSv54]|uniref:Outer membrane protein beta-barrel domain-containing protein n=2 Tax=Desulfotalea psychrophila TaxID=84980 RepID=Q6AKY4_DESPS|nr:conserved hypothetical protein [Desulfotalea psychrophila LSv54]